VHVLSDGTVEGHLRVAATPADVLAMLDDSARVARLTPDVLRATATRSGTCDQLALEARGLFSPIDVHTERCRAPSGYAEHLVDSVVFSAWDARWTVAPADGGADVTFRIRTEITWPVPTSLLRSRTVTSVSANLSAVADAVER
jgi:hypothetical protein